MAADSTIQGSLTEEHKKARNPLAFIFEPGFAGVSFSLMHGLYYGAVIGGPLMWPAIAIAGLGLAFYIASKRKPEWVKMGMPLFTDGLGLLAISLYAGLNVMAGGLPIEAALIPACFAIANIFKGMKMMGGPGLKESFDGVAKFFGFKEASKKLKNTVGLEEFWGSAGAAVIAFTAMGPIGLIAVIPAILGVAAAATNNGSDARPSYVDGWVGRVLERRDSRIAETRNLEEGELPEPDRELPNAETASRKMMGYASLGYATIAAAGIIFGANPALVLVYAAAWLGNRNLEHASRARQKQNLQEARLAL